MNKIKIFCTSTGCLEYAPERYKKYDIGIIHIRVNFKGKEYLEGLTLNPEEFYKELETLENPKSNLPTTAMPTVDEIKSHFEKAIAEGYQEAIVIALSSYLGGTYNLIRLIAEDYQDRIQITVMDSKITSFGEGLLAIKAYEMAEKGFSTSKIIKELQWMISHQELLGVNSKLDYLIYNGRLKGGQAFLGKSFAICPVIHFTREGELTSLCREFTTKRALLKTCKLLQKIIDGRKSEDYVLWHVYTGKSVLSDLKKIEDKYKIKCNHEDVIMSPVIGCHNGPWLAGYGLLLLRREDEVLE